MILGLLASIALGAPEVRVGLFLGNDEGHTGDQRLLFATADATKMRDLFVVNGGMAPDDALLLTDANARNVVAALQRLQVRIARANAEGSPTTLVFYYSGHGDEEGLHLGTSELGHDELRHWLDQSGATVKLAFLDACKSGSAIRQKGGVRGPAFDFALGVEETRGTAILTSSSSSENSQESRELGGGFFTYYLHGALHGAADSDHNGEVTLTEAYAYVHSETALGTQKTAGAQTPSFDFDLVGAGDVVLTRLEAASSYLSFQSGLSGTYSIWDVARRRYVAELDGQKSLRIALRPGSYHVHLRKTGWVEEAKYTLRKGETLAVLAEDFAIVSYSQTAAKGALDLQYRRATLPDWSLRASLGIRSFTGDTPYRTEYIPAHAILGVEGRMLSRKGPYLSFDLLTGAGRSPLEIADLGNPVVVVWSTSIGGVAGWATKPALIRAGIGGRAEVVGFGRRFVDRDLPSQFTPTLGVGFNGWLGLHHGRFSVDLQLDQQLAILQWDDNRPALYGDIRLSSGYRF